MPNWCANRLMFSGIQNSDALKTWIAGGEPSLHRRARKEGIQLFQAGCAGILRPLTEQHYAPYPQLVSYGAAADNRPSVQAYSDWLAMFMAGLKPARNCISAGWTAILPMPAGPPSVNRYRWSSGSCTSKNHATGGTVSGLRRWMNGGTACATLVLPYLLLIQWISATCCRRVWILR